MKGRGDERKGLDVLEPSVQRQVRRRCEASRWAIALGSNLAGSEAALRLAWQAVTQLLALREARLSEVWVSEPAEGASGPLFSNAVGTGLCSLGAVAGLARLQRIESAFGRDRAQEGYHGARPLDLDLIAIDGIRCASARLTLPHPRWHLRPFVAGPLASLWPGLMAPDGQSAAQCAARLRAQSGEAS